VKWGQELAASRMIEPRILALGERLHERGNTSPSATLAGLFVLLGSGFAESAAMLRRAAEVENEDGATINLACRAIKEQQGKPLTPLGVALQKALEGTS
jgi:hypothetical protein